MDQNYEEEMYKVLKVTEEGLAKCQSPLCKNRNYKEFYKNIKNLLEKKRDQKAGSLRMSDGRGEGK